MSLAKHSTWQLIQALNLASLLPEDATAERKIEIGGYVAQIQRELANRVAEGRMAQGLPERMEDYNA